MLNSIIQTNKNPEMSDRYQHVTTTDLVKTIEAQGWQLNRSYQSKVRKESRDGFQAHLLVFRNPLVPEILPESNARSIPELIIVNSHDGTRALRGMLGLFRTACLNGIFSGTCFKEFRATHSVAGLGRINEGLELLLDSVGEEVERVKALSAIDVTPDQVKEYFNGLATERLSKVQGEVLRFRTPNPRRNTDLGFDAYTVLNRGQEMLLRGGIQYVYRKTVKDTDRVVQRMNKTRAVYSIPQSIALNKFAVESMNQLIGV